MSAARAARVLRRAVEAAQVTPAVCAEEVVHHVLRVLKVRAHLEMFRRHHGAAAPVARRVRARSCAAAAARQRRHLRARAARARPAVTARAAAARAAAAPPAPGARRRRTAPGGRCCARPAGAVGVAQNIDRELFHAAVVTLSPARPTGAADAQNRLHLFLRCKARCTSSNCRGAWTRPGLPKALQRMPRSC